MKKSLSVIVPAYNMEALLPRCLSSMIVSDKCLMSTLEVIVVNDGSKDRTSGIAHEFCALYPSVFSVIDKPNGNYGSCINVGLKVAHGSYIRVLDSDDYVETCNFEEYLRCVAYEDSCGTDGVDLIVTDYDRVGSDCKQYGKCNYGMPEECRFSLIDAARNGIDFTIHSITYKLANVRNIKYIQTEGVSYTDTEWITEPMIKVRTALHLPVTVTHYFVGRAGQTTEDKIFAVRFGEVIGIVSGMVSRYKRLYPIACDEAREYYRRRIINSICMVYGVSVFGWNGYKVNVDIGNFDDELSLVPELYHIAEEFTIRPKFLPTIHYVRLLRKRGFISNTMLCIFKMYALYAARLKRIKTSYNNSTDIKCKTAV